MRNNKTKSQAFTLLLLVCLTACANTPDQDRQSTEIYEHTSQGNYFFGSRLHIKASKKEIWRVLIETQHYPTWNPFTPKVNTTFEVGTPIAMHVRLIKRFPTLLLKQTETVADFIKEEKMCWRYTIISNNIFHTYRCYELKKLDNNKTQLNNSMHYEGFFAEAIGVITKPFVMDGFVDVSMALKEKLTK